MISPEGKAKGETENGRKTCRKYPCFAEGKKDDPGTACRMSGCDGRSGFQVGERRDHAGSIDDYGAGAFFCGIGGCLAGISVAEQLA